MLNKEKNACNMQAQAEARGRATIFSSFIGNKNDVTNKFTKIDLPKLDGKIQNYFLWKFTFDVLIEKNLDLDENSKYLYLEQSITSDGHKIVDHLKHSPESYQVTLALLEKKYGGSERQIEHLYNKVIGIKFVKDFLSLQEFQYTLLRCAENFIPGI